MPEGNTNTIMDASTSPQTMDEFYRRLRELGDGLPRRLRQCADYLAANPERVAVSTVAELSGAAGVQPSAFIRFCQELGFTGFSQMQKLFRDDYSQKWPDYSTRLVNLRDRGDESPPVLLAEFVEAGRNSLENLMQTVDPKSLERAVGMLSKARTIHVVGYRRAFPVASYLVYAFEKMKIPSILHSGVGNLSFAHMLSPDDAMIAITFAPYGAATVELARKAEEAGTGIVAMTDNMTSPLVRLNAVPLLVTEIDVGAFRALSATLSLAITLAVSVGIKRKIA